MIDFNKRLDEILSHMAFKCAGGITDDGRKEYTPAKQALTSLIKELVKEAKPVKAIISDDEMGIDRARKSAANNAINQFEQNLLKALEEV